MLSAKAAADMAKAKRTYVPSSMDSDLRREPEEVALKFPKRKRSRFANFILSVIRSKGVQLQSAQVIKSDVADLMEEEEEEEELNSIKKYFYLCSFSK